MAVGGLVAELGHAGTAGYRVVDDDGGLRGVGLAGDRHTADVPAVADGEQRQDADGRVLDRVQGCAEPRARSIPAAARSVGSMTYQMARVTKRRRREVERLACATSAPVSVSLRW